MRDNKTKWIKAKRKPYEKWIRERKKNYAPLNNDPLNLPENNLNSLAELRMNALILELRLGSP